MLYVLLTPVFAVTRRIVGLIAAVAKPTLAPANSVSVSRSSWSVKKSRSLLLAENQRISKVAETVLTEVAGGVKTFVVLSAVTDTTHREMTVVDCATSRLRDEHDLDTLDDTVSIHTGVIVQLLQREDCKPTWLH